MPLVRAPVTCELESYRDSAAPAALTRVVLRLYRTRGVNSCSSRARPSRRARSSRGWSCQRNKGSAMPRIAFPNSSRLRRDRSDALIKPEGLGNSGHCSQHCRLCQLGSRRPVLPAAPRPTLHFRNGVSEHVSLQTALTPSSSQRVLATQRSKTTLQQHVVDGN